MEWDIALKIFRKNLNTLLITRISVIFSLTFILVWLFHFFVLPYYYYWEMEKPVKQGRERLTKNIKISKIEKKQGIIIIEVKNYQEYNENSFNQELQWQIAKKGIKLNDFWVDQKTIANLKRNKKTQRLYQQKQQKISFYTIMHVSNKRFYLLGTSIVRYQDVIAVILPLYLGVLLLLFLLIAWVMYYLIRKQFIYPIQRLDKFLSEITYLNFEGEDTLIENELGILMDRIRQMRMALKEYQHEWLTYNKQLKNFASTLSHELKTPLSIMQLAIDGQKMGLDTDTLPDLSLQIEKMNHLIDQMLTVSYELRKDAIKEKVELEKKFEQFILQYQLIDPAFKFKLDLEKINLFTDKHTLSLVLNNLISNALKYSGDQQLNVTGKKSGENYVLTFSNAINSSLKPLKQVEKTAKQKITASHLGLIIAQEAAEKLGGKLNLKQERQNFIVKFTIPIER
ncbi:MAG: HAMP domain-containing histidine kinase [Lactobacillales bacterium]|jgi:signal transduction histidine kinase|nr:HAMP domain-containing histidine kinase [Lactobacillales bacterium]